VPNTCLKLQHCLSPTCAFALSATTLSCRLHTFSYSTRSSRALHLIKSLPSTTGYTITVSSHHTPNVTTRAHAVVQSIASFVDFFCFAWSIYYL
jgi:hypothetical protein